MDLLSKGTPVILKEESSAQAELAELERLRGNVSANMETRLESDIRALKAGIAGEERVLYELRNSHMDMFVLQDLYLEHNGLSAQIDSSPRLKPSTLSTAPDMMHCLVWLPS